MAAASVLPVSAEETDQLYVSGATVNLVWTANTDVSGTFEIVGSDLWGEETVLAQVAAVPGRARYAHTDRRSSGSSRLPALRHYELRFRSDDGREYHLGSLDVVTPEAAPVPPSSSTSSHAVADIRLQWLVPPDLSVPLGESSRARSDLCPTCPPAPPPRAAA